MGDARADVFEVAVGHYTSGTTRGGNADGRRAVVAPPFFVDTSGIPVFTMSFGGFFLGGR